MVLLGILVGIFEVIIGIIFLFANVFTGNNYLSICMGIGYILSGLLFIWLCVGAQTAFNDSKKYSELSSQIESLKEKIKNLEDKDYEK